MRVTRAEAEKNRERIIETASRLFRERGFDGIGVAELMKVVGLTHGGFYGHFSSKEDLMAQACAHALKRSLDALQHAAEQGGENALSAVASTYLTATHRDQPADGCMFAALGAEAARHDSPVRSVFTQGVRSVVEALTQLLPGDSIEKKRKRALRRLKRANDVLMDFINREMRMTGSDQRIDDLASRLAAVSNDALCEAAEKRL